MNSLMLISMDGADSKWSMSIKGSCFPENNVKKMLSKLEEYNPGMNLSSIMDEYSNECLLIELKNDQLYFSSSGKCFSYFKVTYDISKVIKYITILTTVTYCKLNRSRRWSVFCYHDLLKSSIMPFFFGRCTYYKIKRDNLQIKVSRYRFFIKNRVIRCSAQLQLVKWIPLDFGKIVTSYDQFAGYDIRITRHCKIDEKLSVIISKGGE